MFGHHDDDDQANQPSQPQDNPQPVDQPDPQVVHPGDAAAAPEPQVDDSPWQHPGTPLDTTPAPAAPAASEPVQSTPAPPAPQPEPDNLVDIRQKALGDLSPLINHLEHQTPEEKFQVTMMMIQANDDKSLIQTAYEAAQQITDEKVRAQALLDIVQEINYFTQHEQN